MIEPRADFAIVGSTPLARLVAGLLASAHGRSVVFAGESQSSYRLPRGIDLSVAPITRPETWSLLKQCVPETLKLLSRIGGRASWSRVDPMLFAEHDAGKEALAHIRQTALAFGHGAEIVPPATIGRGRAAIVLRDAVQLHRPQLEPRLDAWLEQHAVRRVAPGESIAVRTDGSGELATGGTRIAIDQVVLADDPAIIAHVQVAHWPALLSRRVASTIFTEPTRAIAAPVMQQLDNSLTLSQSAGRGIVGMGPGAIDPFAATLGGLLGREREFRQAGQSSYEAIATEDAAPAAGRVRGSGPDVLAGFGPTGAFLAPALARWLAGEASNGENAWLGARLIDRKHGQSPVAEFGAQP